MIVLVLAQHYVLCTSLAQSPATSKSVEITGYICGYLASIFYLSSRFPQLYKNVSDNFLAWLRCGVCYLVPWFACEHCHPESRAWTASFFFQALIPGGRQKTLLIICQLVIKRDRVCLCQNENQALKTMVLLLWGNILAQLHLLITRGDSLSRLPVPEKRLGTHTLPDY